MKKYLIILFLLPSFVMAQRYANSDDRPNFTITGLVLDTISNEPLSFAALSVISLNDNKLIQNQIDKYQKIINNFKTDKSSEVAASVLANSL